MPMHPRVQTQALAPLLELLFGTAREPALEALLTQGLLDNLTLPHWHEALQRLDASSAARRDLSAAAKLLVDPLIAAEGLLSTCEPLAVIGNLLCLLDAARQHAPAGLPGEPGTMTVLDYGAGIYYPLSSAMILFANGYGRVIAYEPFELNVDYVVASVWELIRAMFASPAAFAIGGGDAMALKQSLACLDFSDLAAKLTRLNRREVDLVDLGGVSLTHSRDCLAPGSIDLIFSNSVLEHVDDLAAEIDWQRQLLRPGGLCLHTVDFADHRYYFDKQLHLFEMYYDGVLDGINGLRPSQMEAVFRTAGLAGLKLARIDAPADLLAQPRQRVAPYAELAEADLLEWVNGYILQKIR